MTDAERLLWSKIRGKQLKGHPYMAKAGIAVLRFSDREVLNNLDAVLEEIWRQL